MIYFLINNTFHRYTTDLLVEELIGCELSLIQIPYSLKPVNKDDRFTKIFVLERLPYTFEFLRDFPRVLFKLAYKNFKNVSNVRKIIKPKKKDILFVFTETELLNSIIISSFKRRNASIFLIEDGCAAYVYYNMKSDPLSKRTRVFKWVIRLAYGLKGFNPFNVNGYFYPQISDNYFSGICYFLPIKIKRDIPVYKLKKPVIPLSLKSTQINAIFLTQPIYNKQVNLEEYLINLDLIFSKISHGFSIFYLKLHPDEMGNDIEIKILKIASKYSNIRFLNTSEIIVNIVHEFNISYAISFTSTALMDLIFYGIEPVYIFHLFDFFKDGITKQLSIYLKTLEYNFPLSYTDIKPGYKSGIIGKASDGITIRDLIYSVNNNC